MDATSPTRPPRSPGLAEDDPIRTVYLAAIDGNDILARLILAFLTVISEGDSG